MILVDDGKSRLNFGWGFYPSVESIPKGKVEKIRALKETMK